MKLLKNWPRMRTAVLHECLAAETFGTGLAFDPVELRVLAPKLLLLVFASSTAWYRLVRLHRLRRPRRRVDP